MLLLCEARFLIALVSNHRSQFCEQKVVEKKSRISAGDNSDAEVEEEATPGRDFNYILGMPIWSLTKERKEDLENQVILVET